MEILLLVLLLMNGKGENDLKQTLNTALSFYRENRELIQLLLSTAKGQQSQPTAPSECAEQAKSRPQSAQSADSSIIEELLKKQF